MSDLRGFTAPEPIETGNTGKIFGALAVALVVCAVGSYTYETGMWNSPTVRVADNDLPSVPTTTPLPRMIAPPPTAPVQNVPVQQTPPQAAAPAQPVETLRPQHVLAQHTPRAVMIAPPTEPAIDQTPTAIAPQAPADAAAPAPASPQPQSTAQPDAPAQTPQPDGTPQ